jgi:SecY interacting protein Syd
MKTVIRELFDRMLANCRRNRQPFPAAPWDPDIESFIWRGVPSASGWCAWEPLEKTRVTNFSALAPDLGHLHDSISDYFNAWWFCSLEGRLGSSMLTFNPVAPGIEHDSFVSMARNYRRARPSLNQIPIGLDNGSSLQVVVDNRTGVVSIDDWERGTFQEIAPSLDELLRRLEV